MSLIEKFKYWKILLKNIWKIGTAFDGRGWKIGTPLARCNARLNNWYTFGTFISTLARKNEELAR